MDLAKALERAGDLPAAEAALRAALSIRQGAGWGHTGPETAATAKRLAAVLEKEGKAAEAAAVRADAGVGPATRPAG